VKSLRGGRRCTLDLLTNDARPLAVLFDEAIMKSDLLARKDLLLAVLRDRAIVKRDLLAE
jgi:hypothetical protein